MKILITTPVFPPEIGGPATYTKELCKRLRDNHQITVVAFAGQPEPIERIELKTVALSVPLIIRQFIFLTKVVTSARKADLIYTQNAMAAGVPSVIAAKITKRPIILKFVGDGAWEKAFGKGQTKKFLDDFLKNPDAGLKSRLRIWVQKVVLNKVDKIIAPSAYLKSVLATHYRIPEYKIDIVYNAAEEEAGSESSRDPNTHNKHQVITVARLVPWKCVDGIIQAIKILEPDFPDIRLVIAGDGPEMEKLRKLVADLGLSAKVHFTGKVTRTETAKLRHQSAVFVLNSTYEGLPHSVLSSFAARIPVIATNIPGTNEAVYERKTGLLVPPNNPIALAKAIKEIFNDETLAQSLVRNGTILLEERFSWQSHINQLSKLFNSLISIPRN